MTLVHKTVLLALLALPMAIAQMKPVTGIVSSVEVTGNGPSSAQIVFNISSGGNNQAFVVLAYPSSEPQVFVAMSNLVTSAMLAKKKVTVTFDRVPGRTDRAIGIQMLKQ